MQNIQQQLPLESSEEKPEASEKQKPAVETPDSQEDGIKGSRNSWQWMRARCLNPKIHGYHNYGGRGIKICERWLKFDGFLADMGPRPIGHVIDRIDPNGHYEPANCRWQPKQLSGRNRRYHPIPFVDGQTVKERQFLIHKSWVSRNRQHRKQYSSDMWKKNKPAMSARFKAWRLANKDKRKATHIKYAKKHPDRVKASLKKWNDKNKDYVREKRRQYAIEHREEIAAKKRIHYLKNRDAILAKEMARYWARKVAAKISA